MKRLALLLAASSLVACGGASGPASPGPVEQAPVTVSAIDGWTDQRVAAEISPAVAVPGTLVTVRSPGFLTREQVFDGGPVALWAGTEDWTAQVVYGWSFDDGIQRLVRWDRPFTVSLDPALASDPEIVARLDAALAEIRRSTGLAAVRGTGGEVTVSVDASLGEQGAIGDAHIQTRGGVIAAARVRLISRDEFYGDGRSNSPHTLLHELGHVAGLWHSPRADDVMHPGGLAAGRQARSFSGTEQIALHMMYAHRRPGNLPVDREAGPGAMAARGQELRVVD